MLLAFRASPLIFLNRSQQLWTFHLAIEKNTWVKRKGSSIDNKIEEHITCICLHVWLELLQNLLLGIDFCQGLTVKPEGLTQNLVQKTGWQFTSKHVINKLVSITRSRKKGNPYLNV